MLYTLISSPKVENNNNNRESKRASRKLIRGYWVKVERQDVNSKFAVVVLLSYWRVKSKEKRRVCKGRFSLSLFVLSFISVFSLSFEIESNASFMFSTSAACCLVAPTTTTTTQYKKSYLLLIRLGSKRFQMLLYLNIFIL